MPEEVPDLSEGGEPPAIHLGLIDTGVGAPLAAPRPKCPEEVPDLRERNPGQFILVW
jgi:hypothetical protein